MANCIIITSPSDLSLVDVIRLSFLKGGSSDIQFISLDSLILILKTIKEDLKTVTPLIEESWATFSPVLSLALGNYLFEVGFTDSSIYKEYSRINNTLDLGSYIDNVITPILNSSGVDLVKGDLATNYKKEKPLIPSLSLGLSSIFSNTADMSWYVSKYRNTLIHLMFISETGIIADDGDFSNLLLVYQLTLIDTLVDKVEEAIELNETDFLTDELKLDIDLLLTDLKSIDTTDLVDSVDTKKNLKKLFFILDRYYSNILTENNGKFFSIDLAERSDFGDLVTLRNFDTFIETYLGDLITVLPGYKNSYRETKNGQPKYRRHIAADIKLDWDDSHIEDAGLNANKIVAMYIKSLPILGTSDSYINFSDFNRAINEIRNKFPNDFGSVRSNPDEIRKLWERMYLLYDKDATIDSSIRRAIATVYKHVFDKSNRKSLYYLYTYKGDIKYNLYNMIVNLINTTAPLSYLRTRIGDEGNIEVALLESGLVTTKRSIVEKGLMAYALDVNYYLLMSMNRIEEILDKNGKLEGYNLRLGTDRIQATLQGDFIRFVKNDKYLVSSPKSKIDLLQLYPSQVRELLLVILNKTIDTSYWSLLMTMPSLDLSNLLNLAVVSLVGMKVQTDIIPKVTIKETSSYVNRIKESFPSITFSNESSLWFDANKKAIKVGGLLGAFGGLTAIARTNSVISGDNSKTYVLDAGNNKLPKFGLTSAMNDDTILRHRLVSDFSALSPYQYNIYGMNPDILGNSNIDLEVTNSEGTTKSVSLMTSGELEYHGFINRYLSNKGAYMYILSTTYADKSRIWTKRISTSAALDLSRIPGLEDLNGKSLNQVSVLDLARIHRGTMGTLFNLYKLNFFTNTLKLLNKLGFTADNYEEAIKKLNSLLLSESDLNNAILELQLEGLSINIFPEALYKILKGIVVFRNVTFLYMDYMFNNEDVYNAKMEIEKSLYAWKLMDDKVKFELIDSNGYTNSIVEELYKAPEYYDWINTDTKEIIPYKIYHKGELVPSGRFTIDNIYSNDYRIELHPELDRYFLLHTLLSDNYNATLFGFPYGHKGLKKPVEWEPSKATSKEYIRKIKLDEGTRTTSMHKRGVIGGATIRPLQLGLLNGIRSIYKISVIDDIADLVFTILAALGDDDTSTLDVTPYDGGIWLNPFTAILEANSLPEISLSEVHRKPICHFSLAKYGLAGLLKCATFSLNNDYIRNSKSKIIGRDILKRISDIKWNDTRIDISKEYSRQYYFNPTDFKYYKLDVINKVNGTEYAISTRLIDKLGDIIPETASTINIIINSNYDLWSVLGGEYSVSKDGNRLVFSETSILETVNTMNSTNFKKVNATSNRESLENFELPLKEKLIDYLVNVSAIKNGLSNVNPASKYYLALYDIGDPKSNFTTMDIETDFLGIQLNAEHGLSDSEVAEMTLVISSMELMGHTHNLAILIYQNIGRTIANQLLPYMVDLSDPEKYSEIYNILGKLLILIYGTKEEGVGLTQAYIQAVSEDIKNNVPYSELTLKIPFNDPNIAKALQTGFTSGINKDIIKREYDGIAAVQAPSHDLVMLYSDSDGHVYKHEDLLTSSKSLDEYESKLSTLDNETPVSLVQPGDYVLILNDTGDVITEGRVSEYRLENGLGIRDLLDTRSRVRVLGSKGRNLRALFISFNANGVVLNPFDLDSSKLSWELRDILLLTTANNYEEFIALNTPTSMRLVEAVNRLQSKYPNIRVIESINKFLRDKKGFKNVRAFLQELVLMDLNMLLNGTVILPIGLREDPTDVTPVQISDYKYFSNEMMLGRLWLALFRLLKGDRLSDIISAGPLFFVNKLTTETTTHLNNSRFSAFYTRPNGDHLYIATSLKLVKGLEKAKPDILFVDGQLYRVENGEITYKVSPKFLYYTAIDENGESYEIVYIPELLLLSARNWIESSKEFTTLLINLDKYNYKPLNDLVSRSKLVNKEIKLAITDIEGDEEAIAEFNKRLPLWKSLDIMKLANAMYQSFNLATKFIVARIPAQSMLSFMNMLITGFADTDTNLVWVGVLTLSFQGSDY